jgi:hypothetical protein
LEEKERKSKKKKNTARKSSGPLPDGKKALINKTSLKERSTTREAMGPCQMAQKH